ncbi:hypothetical protein HYFRA_00013891 [Hymenoscyphus fraxineus]|uniref:Uncharacterized protein n=1 Tax=Hymenoscyphus fraxineus TaxID=746836 RepID=A0A9N9LAD3_9HELO|nr:hypothetical protein HYFRA_00013891 [Hymenoscyphus fraxineus]
MFNTHIRTIDNNSYSSYSSYSYAMSSSPRPQLQVPANFSSRSSTSSDSSSSSSSFSSMDSRSYAPRVETLRCSRCAKCVETVISSSRSPVTSEDALANGMVQFGHNLYYCERCARMGIMCRRQPINIWDKNSPQIASLGYELGTADHTQLESRPQ